MERNKVALTLITAAAILGLTPFAISETSVDKQVVEFEPKANVSIVSNNSSNVSLGLAPGKKGLNFGDLPLQSTQRARKTVDLDASDKALVIIKDSGNASEFLRYDEKHYFQGQKEIKIEFETEEPGYYEGDLKLKILTPRNELGKKWIELRSLLYF